MGMITRGGMRSAPSWPSPPGQQAPLASSTFRLDCLHTNPPPPQSIKMRRFAPTSSPFILAVSFLCIGMMRLTNLSRMICRLHVSSKVPIALIFLVEYSLEFPFSSAMLIRSPGYSYYRSSKDGLVIPGFYSFQTCKQAFLPLKCLNLIQTG